MPRADGTTVALLTLSVAALSSGCITQRLPVAGREAPVRNVVRASQYAFTTDFELDSQDPIVRDLVGLRQAVYDATRLPPGREPIRVVIFESQQRYHEFLGLNFPDLPARRAFFVKQNEDELAVFAFRSETLLEDLRHESTHALLHSSLKMVPIWLDEGLACYFEVGPELDGVNTRHVVGLRSRSARSTPTPAYNLQRLESLGNLWHMTADDYRESWLWVHFCFHHSPATREALLAHLAALRRGAPDSLATRLQRMNFPLDEAIELHLASLIESVGERASPAVADNYYQPTHSLWQTSWATTRKLLRPLDTSRSQ